jgi:hypothetical protein
MKATGIILALALLLPANARGEGFSAEQLHRVCSGTGASTQQERDAAETACGAYLLGLTDALFVMQSLADRGTRTCMPKEVAVGVPEARSLFENYFKSHPDVGQNSAGLVVGMAVVNAFKCPPTN